MKETLRTVNKYFLIAVTAVQTVFALIYLVLRAKTANISLLGLLSVLAVILGLAFVFAKDRKKILWPVLFVFTLPAVFTTATSEGRFFALPDAPKGTIAELKMQRFVWPHISEIGYSYGLDIMEDQEYIRLATSSERLWEDFFPAIEAEYGDYSSAIYDRYTSLSLSSLKREVVPEILRDFADHMLAPFTLEADLYGKAGSNNAGNLEEVTQTLGKAGTFYLHFGTMALALLFLLKIVGFIAEKDRPRWTVNLSFLLAAALVSLYDIFFPLRGFDYKNAALILILWGLYASLDLRRKNADR